MQQALLAIGKAVWELQTLEDGLATHLALRHDLAPGCSKAELEQAMARRRAMTFGQLLQQPQLTASLSVECLARLASLKADRNWLIHASRRALHVELYTPATGANALARVEAITKQVGALRHDVWAETATYLHGVGLAPATGAVNAILSHWATGKRHPGEIGET